MVSKRGLSLIGFTIVLLQSTHQSPHQDCNPSLDTRMDECTSGYCCARDEFLPTYVYCKAMGERLASCTMRDTESACPCQPGLYCRPNIESASFHSMYGTCHPTVNDTASAIKILG